MDNNLALGFRFYPTEEELISFYLRNKLEGTRPDLDRVIPVLDIYSMDPWQLPQFAGELCRGDTEQWFFFVPRQERDAHGGRTSRTTASGYWKATGSPCYAYSSGNRIIGVKKSMVFYKGKVPNGTKTQWKMNEYRAILAEASSSSCSSRATPNPTLSYEYSACRAYIGSGSLRAFDRRPTGVTTSNMEMQHVHLVTSSSSNQVVMTGGNGEMATTSQHHQNPPNMKKLSRSSLDSSSYGGGDDSHPPNQNGESTLWEIFYDDLQPLLELENLDWD